MWRFLKSGRDKGSETDIEIIAAFKRDKNLRHIAVLYDRYAQILFAACMKYLRDEEESKDAVSRIFEKLPEDLTRFDVKQFNSWLHRVGYNYCMNILEKKNRIKVVHPDDILSDVDEIPEPDYASITDEQLRDAISKLEEHQRSCIELFFFKENSYTDIALKTGYSLLQVKSYLQNGKRNLKLMLTTNGK